MISRASFANLNLQHHSGFPPVLYSIPPIAPLVKYISTSYQLVHILGGESMEGMKTVALKLP